MPGNSPAKGHLAESKRVTMCCNLAKRCGQRRIHSDRRRRRRLPDLEMDDIGAGRLELARGVHHRHGKEGGDPVCRRYLERHASNALFAVAVGCRGSCSNPERQRDSR